MPFAGNESDVRFRIPFALLDYLSLFDWTGRVIRTDKHGAIDQRLPCSLDAKPHFNRRLNSAPRAQLRSLLKSQQVGVLLK